MSLKRPGWKNEMARNRALPAPSRVHRAVWIFWTSAGTGSHRGWPSAGSRQGLRCAGAVPGGRRPAVPVVQSMVPTVGRGRVGFGNEPEASVLRDSPWGLSCAMVGFAGHFIV